MARTNMYPSAKTWSPFKGCFFDCSYCKPTFQAQAKRQLHICRSCYDYIPHEHPERLSRMPSAKIIFVAGNSDLSFCRPSYLRQIVEAIKCKNLRCPARTYYLQSKRPECFARHLRDLPENVILVTTLETNRDAGYSKISKAPRPSSRIQQFRELKWPRKVVTIEPVLNFDLEEFSAALIEIKPEYIWLGYNSRPRQVTLPEPSQQKMLALMAKLHSADIPVKGKDLRGLQ